MWWISAKILYILICFYPTSVKSPALVRSHKLHWGWWRTDNGMGLIFRVWTRPLVLAESILDDVLLPTLCQHFGEGPKWLKDVVWVGCGMTWPQPDHFSSNVSTSPDKCWTNIPTETQKSCKRGIKSIQTYTCYCPICCNCQTSDCFCPQNVF